MLDLVSSGALVPSKSVGFGAETLPSHCRACRTGVALEFCYFYSLSCPLFLRNGSTRVKGAGMYAVRTDGMVREPGVGQRLRSYVEYTS